MNHCFFPKIDVFSGVKGWLKRNSCWIKFSVALLLVISLALNAYQYKIIKYYKQGAEWHCGNPAGVDVVQNEDEER
jgi:hypothetical protein